MNLDRIALFVLFTLATVPLSFGAVPFTETITKDQKMKKFELPILPYKAGDLAPVISEQTINYHYGKHLMTYITNLNNLLVGTTHEGAKLEDIVCGSDGALFNNAAQTFNHIFYFNTFAPESKAQHAPTGKLLEAINKKWGSFANFQKEFDATAVGLFGSGWVWLAKGAKGELSIVKCPNAENPLKSGLVPLLTADVWEHGYYLDYQNRRADHLKELWRIVDWKKVDERY